MKIAFLIDHYVNPHAGTEGQILMLTELLQRGGHEVRLGVLRVSKYTEDGHFPAPVDDLEVGSISSPRAVRRIFTWGQQLARDGFEIVQLYFDDVLVIAPWPLKLAGLRVVAARRDMAFWRTPARLALLRAGAPALDALLANSIAVGDDAARKEWVDVRKVRVIGNGLAFDEAAAETARAPAERGGRIGLVGNARPVKRIGDLVEAFARLLTFRPDAELVIVGGGALDELRTQAERLGIVDRVEFAGPQEDPAHWIRGFDVGVLCSESEGFSNAILEYMMHGLPVVATDTGGNRELVLHEQTGLLVPVANPEALGDAILALLEDPENAARMGEAGRERVRREFSPQRMLDAHLDLYQSISGSGERRRRLTAKGLLKSTLLRTSRAVGGYAAARRASADTPKIFMYHRFSSSAEPRKTSAFAFERQVAYLARHYNVMTMGEFIRRLHQDGRAPKRTAVITVDDGYRDFLQVALPILERHGVPATLYATTRFVDGDFWLWPDRLEFALLRTREAMLHLPDATPIPLNSNQDRGRAWEQLVERCVAASDDDRRALIEQVTYALGVSMPERPEAEYVALSWHDLRRLANAGIEIGAHTCSHPILSRLAPHELHEEIAGSRRVLEERLERPVVSFCYPNGMPADISAETKAAVKAAGFTSSVAAYFRPDVLSDLYEIKRYSGGDDWLSFERAACGVTLYADALRARWAS